MAKSPSFVVGDTVTIKATFKVDGVLTTPTTTTITVQDPEWTKSYPTVLSVSTGVRSCTYTPTQAGWHRWQVEGTGVAARVKQGAFYVKTSGLDDT